MDLLIQRGETSLAGMLRGFLREAVRLNFGDAYLPFVPKVSLSAAEEADLADLATGLAAIGYEIAPSQLPEADAKLGFTPRSDAEVAQAATKAAAPPPTPPVSPGKSLAPAQDDPEEDDDDDSGFTRRVGRSIRALFTGRKKKVTDSRRKAPLCDVNR